MTFLEGTALVLIGLIVEYFISCAMFDYHRNKYTKEGIMEYRGEIYTVKKLFEELEI